MAENLSITHLRTFIWVASLASFRKTAEKMNTTQPAISSRIAKLEEILGVRLFDRDTGNIQITPEGEALRPHAEDMIRTAERLGDIVKGESASSGTLHMGVTEFAVHTWLPKFIEASAKVFPNVNIDLTVDTSSNLRRDLVTRALDVAILLGPVNDHRIENLKFGTFEHCWVSAPSKGLKTAKSYNLIDLAKYPVVTGSRTSRLYMEFNGHLKKHSLNDFRLFPCNSYSATSKLIERGIGIGLLPVIYVDEDKNNENLVKITCDWTPSPLDFTGSFPDSPKSVLSEKIVRFAQSLL